MSRYQLNFRCDKTLRDILIIKENHSEWIREACYEKLDREHDTTLIDLKIVAYEQKIKDLKQKKKVDREDKDQVKAILKIGSDQYGIQINQPYFDITNFKRYLRSNIIPKLKRAGCNRFDENSLLKIYKEGKIDV